jgi:hypothetical protein
LLTVALVVYVAVGAWFAFGRAPADEIGAVREEIRELGSAVDRGSGAGDRVDSPAEEVVFGLTAEELLNVVLFVPLPVLVALRWPSRWWAAVPVGVAASAVIELVQLWFLDHRTPHWNDVRSNSVGVLVGLALWAVGVVAVRRWRRRTLGRV